ncbi:hypothetical protein AMA2_53 [Achromobacter phage AMA2]|nr:hypothetical protein AMA2_53 [Achromobacter phage AMA2]
MRAILNSISDTRRCISSVIALWLQMKLRTVLRSSMSALSMTVLLCCSSHVNIIGLQDCLVHRKSAKECN